MRGARVYAEVRGYGTTNDAHHMTAPRPDGAQAAVAMRRALETGGLRSEEVDYVNAHGSSTPLNDATESRAIQTVLGERESAIPVTGTKPYYGHALGASGAIEVAISCLTLLHGWIPPTLNFEEPGEGCELDYVPGQGRAGVIRTVLTNSFGFGGINASLALSAPRARAEHPVWSPFPPTDQLAALLPLAIAAGLDLPLTLLLLGSATSLGFQSPPPGELGDLSVFLVLGMAGLFWLLELWAERRWLSALGWNLAQGLVRPLAGALLALLLIPDAGAPWRYGAALVAALVSLWTQAGRTGWRLLLDLAKARRPPRILVSGRRGRHSTRAGGAAPGSTPGPRPGYPWS